MRFSNWDRVAAFGCGLQLVSQPWDFTPPSPAPYGTLCNYEPAIGSWAVCVHQTVSEHSTVDSSVDSSDLLASSVDWVSFVCRRAGGGSPGFTVAEFSDAARNASHHLVAAPRPPEEPPTQPGRPVPGPPLPPLASPVVLDEYWRHITLNAVRAEFANLDASNDAAMYIYYYMAVVAVLCAFHVRHSRWNNRLRARLVLPTLGKLPHTQPSNWALGGYFPTTYEALLLAGLGAVHTAALVVGYAVDTKARLEPVAAQLVQAVGNRTGIVAFALLPPLVATSARMPLLQRVLGVPYTSVVVLHRWLGRAMMADAVAHSIAFYVHARMEGEPVNWLLWFWFTGAVGTALSVALVVGGTGWLRRRWYEAFVVSHAAMAALFLWLCYEHVRLFGWTAYLYVSGALWAGERLWRLGVLARHGVCAGRLSAAADGLMVLEVPKPPAWAGRPGHYGFVHFVGGRVWQSHPFTLSVVEQSGEDVLRAVIAVKAGVTKGLWDQLNRQVSQPSSASGSLASHASNTSQSSSLPSQSLPALPPTPLSVNVLLEGPYGHTPDLAQFDSVLLLGGGSGVPGPLSAAAAVPDARLVLAVRDPAVLRAYARQIAALRNHTSIYLTGDAGCIAGSVGSAADPTNGLVISDDAVVPLELACGRPPLGELVAQVVAEADQLAASAAVLCCGPPAMNDAVRNAVARSLARFPGGKVEYFEEYQVW